VLARVFKIALLAVFLVLPLVAAYFLLAKKPAGLSFEIVSYDALPGWSKDAAFAARPALVKSCEKLQSLPEDRKLPGASVGGSVADWAKACEALMVAETPAQAAEALMVHFRPLEVSMGGETAGKFTGYYETLLNGSREETERFNVPLHLRPSDLVMVDLGIFRHDLKGRRIAGKVRGGRLLPYADRKAIDAGALDGQDLEILYVDSAVDAFFLHIQGSGRVRMPDGELLKIGYAAQNGHPYLAIGRPLVAAGEIPREGLSMQSIRAWLEANPDRIEEILHQNASYIFFRELGGADGPYGSAAVTLTAGHSLAVDRKHLPLHAPIWLSASHPDPTNRDNPPVPFNRLMVAQDTGGAITGEIRGDVFWGFGDEAEEIAGRMANAGRYWLLLPNALAVKAEEKGRG
jgi:membrane-bound lytic murein transglycosylase A